MFVLSSHRGNGPPFRITCHSTAWCSRFGDRIRERRTTVFCVHCMLVSFHFLHWKLDKNDILFQLLFSLFVCFVFALFVFHFFGVLLFIIFLSLFSTLYLPHLFHFVIIALFFMFCFRLFSPVFLNDFCLFFFSLNHCNFCRPYVPKEIFFFYHSRNSICLLCLAHTRYVLHFCADSDLTMIEPNYQPIFSSAVFVCF